VDPGAGGQPRQRRRRAARAGGRARARSERTGRVEPHGRPCTGRRDSQHGRHGLMVSWSHGLMVDMVSWSHGRMVSWSTWSHGHGLMVSMVDMVSWSHGLMVSWSAWSTWSHGLMVSWSHGLMVNAVNMDDTGEDGRRTGRGVVETRGSTARRANDLTRDRS
jgi:hypothetical protein